MDLSQYKKIDNCQRASERIKTKICEGGESCTLVRLIDRQLGIIMIVSIIFSNIKNCIDRRTAELQEEFVKFANGIKNSGHTLR